jgi:hypothetical protein
VLLLVLLGPGALLQALVGSRERAVETPLYAAAAWVIAFWWLRLLPFGWTAPVIVLGAASSCAIVLWKRAPDLPSVAVWIGAAAVALVLWRSALLPPGVDSAMHTAVARILADARGHPASFRPLWPVDSFGGYPVGQPTLTALIATLGHLDWRAAGLTGHALCYALVLVGFAAAVSRWGGGTALGLAVGAAAVLAARAPLYFWTWGGAPNALGIAFAATAFAAGVDAVRTARRRDAAACAIFASAAVLTHPVSVVALAWAAFPLLVAVLIAHRQRRVAVAHLAAGAFGAVLLCAPYFATLTHSIPPEGVSWTRAFLRETGTLRVVPHMLHDVPLIAGAIAAIAVLATRPKRAALPLALAMALVLLIFNGRVALLPGSFLLYPDRIAVLLLLPIAFLAHDALAHRPRIALVAAAGIAAQAVILQSKTLREGRAHVLATEADLRVLRAAALPASCWVINDYGDAGQWIPALLARPITLPHVHVAFFDLSADVHPCAAFRGERRAYFVDTVPCPGAACETILRDGSAELFRIVDPSLVVHVKPPP